MRRAVSRRAVSRRAVLRCAVLHLTRAERYRWFWTTKSVREGEQLLRVLLSADWGVCGPLHDMFCWVLSLRGEGAGYEHRDKVQRCVGCGCGCL